MKEAQVTLPELALIGGTRVALGVGLGLLLADRFLPEQRRAVGWTLFLVGALSTVPLAFEVLGKYRPLGAGGWAPRATGPSQRDSMENLSDQVVMAGP
jgi:hypothetical protein